ncbi:MAG TPA: hypothetical protein VFG84_00860 [Gemmatimonadaceae bacterium]|jgi:hypothetical protein|nr:hypothetical protein [Gemmatimonadaceae bacterium]
MATDRALAPGRGPAAARLRALSGLTLFHAGMILAPLCAFVVTLVQPADYDYWWHRRTGEYIVEKLAVPYADPFAFTTAGKTWIDHEWLAQVVMYGIDATLGYLALFAFMLGLGVAAWFIIYRLLRAEGVARMQALALSMAPLVLGASHWRPRPSMFTVFFLALLLSELFAARRGERRTLWRLVPIMALWANLHGGYVIGLAVLGIFAAASLLERSEAPGWKHAAIVLGASFLATGLNPYTWRVWLYPFTYFFGDNASLQLVDEWQSADFHQLRNAPFALLLLAAMLTGGIGRRFDAFRSSLLLLFAALALQSMRHQPLFALAWAPCVGVALAERFDWWRTELPLGGRVSPLNSGLLLGAGAALAMSVFASPSGMPFRDAPSGGLRPYPEAGAAYINGHMEGAHVFNTYEWGGFLIERFEHGNRVFIDGRADLHGSLVSEYQRVYRGDRWRESFERYGVDAALLPAGAPLVKDLRADGWRTVYEDGVQVVLVAP